MPHELLEIGLIRRAHGISGQLRVRLHHPASDALVAVRRIFAGQRPCEIEEAQDLGGGEYLIRLRGLRDRTAAEALAGEPLYALREELPPLADGEVYLADLAGCRAVLPDGAVAGTVREVLPLAGQDILVIERDGRPDAMVPLVPAFLREIDLGARRIHIDPPEGLLDLDLGPGGGR